MTGNHVVAAKEDIDRRKTTITSLLIIIIMTSTISIKVLQDLPKRIGRQNLWCNTKNSHYKGFIMKKLIVYETRTATACIGIPIGI
uniref:Uncharacterized protein n=1 Tax=Magallana gigas TaxID=29159 RepID=K1R679_MAGGI